MLADVSSTDIEQSTRILRHRAALLARPAVAELPADTVPVLEFAVGGEALAIELSCLREVRAFSRLVPLPEAQRFVLGVVHLAGRMLPVIDLAADLELATTGAPARHLVVLGRDRAVFGVPVEEIIGVGNVALDSARHRSAALAEVRADLIQGVTGEGRLVIDGHGLLARHSHV